MYKTRDGGALYRGICNGHQYVIWVERLRGVMPGDEPYRDLIGYVVVLNLPGNNPAVVYPAIWTETFEEAENAVWDFAMHLAPPRLNLTPEQRRRAQQANAAIASQIGGR